MTDTRQKRKQCAYCGQKFIGGKLAKYCCTAHKQAAYRQRLNPPMLAALRQADRYKRMVITKASQIKTVKCVGCGIEFCVTGLQGTNKLYHNNTCKQRAYRERRKERLNAVRDNNQRNNS